MTQQEIIVYSLTKRGAQIDFPYGPEVAVVRVQAPNCTKRPIFAQLFSLDGVPKCTLSCTAEGGAHYRQRYPVERGYHCPAVQQPYFYTFTANESIPDAAVREMIDHAYQAVVSKLPKSAQRELDASRRLPETFVTGSDKGRPM